MFVNREEAGMRLALKLSQEKIPRDSIVISIPRGGVVVGKTISQILKLSHQILLVKKIGAPYNPELAIGATGALAIVFWEENLIRNLKISKEDRKRVHAETMRTIKAQEESLGIKLPDVKGKIAVVVDDGVATGATAIAAWMILKKLGSKKRILATPVISKKTKKNLEKYFDKIISVETPEDFAAVGEFYQEFPQVEDEEVKAILKSKN